MTRSHFRWDCPSLFEEFLFRRGRVPERPCSGEAVFRRGRVPERPCSGEPCSGEALCCGRACNRRVKVIRPDTARHPAFNSKTLHCAPTPSNPARLLAYEVHPTASIGGWLTTPLEC